MVDFQVVVVWLALYAAGHSTWSLELPHSTCSYNALSELRCEGAVLDIPHSFSVSLVPSNVTMIWLNCPGASKQNQCNMMRGDLQPLPYRKELVTIKLHGFKTDKGQLLQPNRARIPVPQFLANVKHRVLILEIWFSTIGYLDGEFLRGFHSLQSLSLIANDISTIDVESFRFLMDPLIPTPSTAPWHLAIPRLHEVNLGENNLQDLDWAVFRPTARTLRSISFQGQKPGLSSLRRTGQPFSMELDFCNLWINNLGEIPASVLDTVAMNDGGWFHVARNPMCSSLPSGDCSCCEMMDLMKWIATNPKLSTVSVSFSCGAGSTQLSKYSLFPPAMFAKCPEAQTTGVTFPHRFCYTPKPLRIECSLARFELPSSTRVTTDATTVMFESDGRRQCDNILYDLHHKVLEMASIPTTRTAGNDAVQITCENGALRVNEEDPDASFANKIIFQTDSSLSCHEHLHEFSGFLYALPQNNPGNGESSPVLPIDVWLSDFLICTVAAPLVVNCTAGVLTSSENSVTQSPAITLLLYTDHSLDCRLVLRSVHEHILKQEMVQISSYMYAEREDAVVAVVQHGVTVITENQPNKSTKRNLKYYSAPNQLSRNKFRKLMEVLQSLFGSGTA